MQLSSRARKRIHASMRCCAFVVIAAAIVSCAGTQPIAQRAPNAEQPVGEVRSAPRETAPSDTPATETPPAAQTPSTPTKPIPRKFNLTGYPPGFRFGFNAGCDDARHGLTSASDRTRYNGDSLYRSGWRDGFAVCKGKK